MSSTSINLTKSEYIDLKSRADAYDRIISVAQREVSVTPPVRSAKKVMAEFRQADMYSQEFLKSLEQGLKRSSFFLK